MVVRHKFRSHLFKACLNSQTRPFHTTVCTGQGFNLNVGKIVEQSILDYPEKNFSRNILHPALISLLCIKGGVTFSEMEEKCLRSSPLTLTGVLKAPT